MSPQMDIYHLKKDNMKNYILLLCALCFFTSCSTPQQLAQKHLKKAIKFDPDIIKKQIIDTTITGIAEGTVKIIIPESTGEFDFNCDSLKKALEDAKKSNLNPGQILIHQDSNINMSVKQGLDGKFKVKYDVKSKNIYVPVKVPYEVKVSVPGKLIIQTIPQAAWKYWWFWALACIVVLELLLLLKGSKPVLYIQDKLNSNKTT